VEIDPRYYHDLDLAQQEVVLNKAGHRNVARGVKHG
jgi:hypothetical protein